MFTETFFFIYKKERSKLRNDVQGCKRNMILEIVLKRYCAY